MKRQAYFINFPLVVFYGDASTTPPGSAWTSTYRTDYAPLTGKSRRRRRRGEREERVRGNNSRGQERWEPGCGE